MKKLLLLTVFLLFLSACSNGDKNLAPKVTGDGPAYFEETLNHHLQFSLEIFYVSEDGSTQPVQTSQPVKVKKGKPIKVVATVTNNGEEDYTFDSNPCDGRLSMFIMNNSHDVKLKGEGDVTPEACIESLVTHVLKKGEQITAEATFQTDYDLPEGKQQGEAGNLFTIHVPYANQQFDATFEIEEEPSEKS
ncbi:MAG TPA: hypothetical protein VEY51_05590 [Chondromyces sp.]|nr:hypothetical protein [Chondromyces sp.]